VADRVADRMPAMPKHFEKVRATTTRGFWTAIGIIVS
jgi:hypothetical protein